MNALLTLGTFDLFHAGHVEFLAACRELANHVTVSVNTSRFVIEFKKQAPTMTLEEREAVVRSCRYVDMTVACDSQNAEPTIRDWMYRARQAGHTPKIIAIGSDWRNKAYLEQLGITEDFLRKEGLLVVYIHTTHPLHSSEIKWRLSR